MVFLLYLQSNFASLAQLVEQLIRNEQVGGSSPPWGSFRKRKTLLNKLFQRVFEFSSDKFLVNLAIMKKSFSV